MYRGYSYVPRKVIGPNERPEPSQSGPARSFFPLPSDDGLELKEFYSYVNVHYASYLDAVVSKQSPSQNPAITAMLEGGKTKANECVALPTPEVNTHSESICCQCRTLTVIEHGNEKYRFDPRAPPLCMSSVDSSASSSSSDDASAHINVSNSNGQKMSFCAHNVGCCPLCLKQDFWKGWNCWGCGTARYHWYREEGRGSCRVCGLKDEKVPSGLVWMMAPKVEDTANWRVPKWEP